MEDATAIMVNVCCAAWCQNRSDINKDVQYRRIPTNAKLRRKWLRGKCTLGPKITGFTDKMLAANTLAI